MTKRHFSGSQRRDSPLELPERKVCHCLTPRQRRFEEFFGALTGGALGLAVKSLALEEFELLEEDTLLPEELGRVVPELPGEVAVPP